MAGLQVAPARSVPGEVGGVGAAAGPAYSDRVSYAGDVTPKRAWEILREDPASVLVDCRTEAEWYYVGVPVLDAIGKRTALVEWLGYPTGELNSRFLPQLRAAGVDDDTAVLFICRSGQRSIDAAEAATAAGVRKAYNVLDGFEGGVGSDGHRGHSGWRALGLPWRHVQ